MTSAIRALRKPKRMRARTPAPVAAGVALVLSVTAALLVIAVARPGTRPIGHRTGTPVVVPHPVPGAVQKAIAHAMDRVAAADPSRPPVAEPDEHVCRSTRSECLH